MPSTLTTPIYSVFAQEFSTALAEAYASAPVHDIIMDAMEVFHQSLSAPIRVINWAIGPEPVMFNCKLEADAPFQPGQIVEYVGAPITVIMPDKNSEHVGSLTLRIDNIGDMLDEYIENAAISGGRVTGTYREYIKGTEGDGPLSVFHNLTLANFRMENQTLFMDASILGWMNGKFGRLYTPGQYPSLVVGR